MRTVLSDVGGAHKNTFNERPEKRTVPIAPSQLNGWQAKPVTSKSYAEAHADFNRNMRTVLSDVGGAHKNTFNERPEKRTVPIAPSQLDDWQAKPVVPDRKCILVLLFMSSTRALIDT